MFLFFLIVREQSVAVIESFGKFSRILPPGLHIKAPWERVSGRVSLKIQELQVSVETKTRDDVFVRLMIAVQYFVIPERVREAFYRLTNPVMQIESYVFDEVRSAVPSMSLDDVFQNKDFIANSVKDGLSETMTQYGYGIVRALVNDIDPDRKVKAAMNEINAALRLRKAAEERGEGEKILRVKQAEGEAESKILQGKGIAGQRKAIIDGLRESVQEFSQGVPGVTSGDVMQLVLMTQYFDMLKEIGATSRASTILLPHSPGAMADLSGQLRDAIMAGNLTAQSHRESVNDAGHMPPPRREQTDAPPPEPAEDNPTRTPIGSPNPFESYDAETKAADEADDSGQSQTPPQPGKGRWPRTSPPG